MMKKIILTVLVVTQVGLFSNNLEIKADVNKSKVNINDTFIYSVEIKGNFKKSPQIIIPEFKNFKIIQTMENHSFNFVGGKLEAKIKYKLVLKPLKIGKFKLPQFKIKTFFKTYETNEVQVEIIGKKKEKKQEIEPQGTEGGKIWI